MEDLVDRVLDRTRSRLDIPALRTIVGLKNRPHHNRAGGPPAQAAVTGTSQYGLTWFKVAFITRLTGMADQFATALDCADISFITDGTLDELPLPSRIGPPAPAAST